MNNTNIQAKTRNQVKATTTIETKVETSKGVMVAASVIPAVVGLWAVACFAGGLVASGGPLAMARSFFTAVTGI